VNLYTDTETRFFQNVKYIQGWSTVRVDYMMTVFLPGLSTTFLTLESHLYMCKCPLRQVRESS